MDTPEIDLLLTIDEVDADQERLDELTGYFRQELLDLGAGYFKPVASASAPAGTKGDPFTIGALALVTLPALLPKLVEFLSNWSTNGANRKVRIKTPVGVEIEFTSQKPLGHDEIIALVERLNAIKNPDSR